MKTSHILLVILIALIAGFGGAKLAGKTNAPTQQAKAETAYERITRTGALRCGYAVWPPYIIKDANTGQISGVGADSINAIADFLQLKVEWTAETAWGNYIEDMNTGKFDIMCPTVWPDAARIKNSTITNPLFYTGIYMIVRADDTRFDADQRALNNQTYKIAVMDGDTTASIGDEDFPDAVKLRQPNSVDPVQLGLSVETGKADATFADLGFFNDYAAKNPGKLKIVNRAIPVKVFSEALSVPKGDIALKGMLDAAITELSNRGKSQRY